MPTVKFFNSLSDDFQRIENELSDGIFAAYLLGYDESREENIPKLQTIRKEAKFSSPSEFIHKNMQTYVSYISFADGEDEKSAAKAGPVDLRFDVRPAEAIDYFERKRVVSPKTFNKLEREAKAAAFSVSEIYREDVLTAFKFEISNALDTGQTSKYVTKQFKEILAGAGHKELGDFHLETVARSNMMTAYGVGRRKQMEEVKDLLPYWQLVAVGDDRTRPKHESLSGSVYPADHEFWDNHYAPYDFNCRCNVISLLNYPNDYDHRHPNENTTIVYDNDGLPAKAEYQAQVVDLKATKFAGVPKTADLKKALENAAKAAKDSRLLNHQNIPQVIVDKAREIRLESKEHLIGWDKEGNTVGEFIGDAESVKYPWNIEPLLDDGFDIHNHPPEGKGADKEFFEGLSDSDFFYAVNLNKRATYAVTRNYLYQMRRPQKNWEPDTYDKFWDAWDEARTQIAQKLNQQIREKGMTKAQADDAEIHLIWQHIAKRLKFKYKRFKVIEL